MQQLEIKTPEQLSTSKIYQLVNSQEFLDNVKKSNDGIKLAKRRLRKQLQQIAVLAKAARKELKQHT